MIKYSTSGRPFTRNGYIFGRDRQPPHTPSTIQLTKKQKRVHNHNTKKYLRFLFIAAILLLLIGGLFGEHIQIVLFEESQILSGLGKLSLLHTLPTYQWTKARWE